MARAALGPLVATAGAATAAGCWHLLGPERAEILQPHTDLAGLLTGLCAWALTLAAVWLAVLLALLVAEPYAGRDLAGYAGCPSWLRPTLLGLCGLAAFASLAGPAQASDHPAHPSHPGHSTHLAHEVARGLADGLPVPDRTTTPAAPRRAATVVVGPGDSLWRIAQRRLPSGAGDAAVSHGWRRLYERNRVRIGADPDLIEPGTRLVVPTHTEEQP